LGRSRTGIFARDEEATQTSRFQRFLLSNVFESSLMKKHSFPFAVIALATIGTVMAAGPAKFDGEFVDKKFLNGQGVFEFSIHQIGSALEIAFDAAYSDGHGATPDATGAGKVNGNA